MVLESRRGRAVGTARSRALGTHTQPMARAADYFALEAQVSDGGPELPPQGGGGCAHQTGLHAGADLVSAEVCAIAIELRRLLQYGIHAERSATDLFRWFGERGGR